MNPSKDHNNWITVGEVINLIKKPVALYTSHIVQHWYVKLSKVCLPFGRCTNPGDCQKKKKPGDLCASCNGWYKELAKTHRNSNERQIKWRENCDTSEWPVDLWEVAKFFMPVLGGNKGTTEDAESTDLSSLLNVLTWMKDKAFAPQRRVDLNLVNKLRLEVRNPWAHAPNQVLTDDDLDNVFDIANKFVADLDEVFSRVEVKQCAKDIQFVQANGISNVEFKTLILLRDEELIADVSQMNGEIKHLKEDQSSDRQVIKENEKKLKDLEERVCQLQNIANVEETERRARLKSCMPDKPRTFIGRDVEVMEIISALVEKGCGIVSIVGGPGFGKSTVAVEVSHHLFNDHEIIVIFSYLSNVSTVPEVILRLCRDVGVNPGEDPESSLIFWLRNLEKKVVLVMDNVEQLLVEIVRSEFTELVVTLRKNSQQQLKILTTTRTAFSIPNQTSENIQIRELDEKASAELLRKDCPNEEIKEEYLCELANLCGFVPLALCIAGSRIPDLDDPAELIQWLKDKPMKALQSTDKSQCVRKAIEFSFQMLIDKDKNSLASLSVFNGNFQKKSAQEVIQRDGLETQDFLEQLVARSLIQRSSDKRFVIHSLIRRFLADHDQLQDEKAIAQGLMVSHFLKMCHSLTIKSYSKDGFTSARELLKKDGHNVEETLKVCSQDDATNLNPNVIEYLVSSDIYKSSSRFFYRFGRDLFPRTVLRNFHESCIKLAKNREQITIEITFQCLVADQEGSKSAWRSSECIDRMEAMKVHFDSNRALLKEDKSLVSYCYYFYARYYSYKPTNTPCPDLPEDDLAPLSENKARSPFENADETLISLQRAHLNKKRASKVFHSNKEKYEEYMNCATSIYNKALSSAEEFFGDHEITCVACKSLGDLYFSWRKNDKAVKYYSHAIKLRKKLQLDSNEHFVNLVKNYGSCLSFLCRFDESVENLHEARDIAEMLAEKDTPCRAHVYYELAKAFRFWKPDCLEAEKYAKEAMKMQELLDPRSVKALQEIIKTAEKSMA